MLGWLEERGYFLGLGGRGVGLGLLWAPSGPWERQAGHISKGRLPLEEAGLAGHMGLV